ncbi:MAG: DUF1254 domain-containing protein [Acidimicrobiaceae bacterium]|nr:DUF1254 domain-containing protein [Acidimicrobiaceae bacterium]
MIEQALDPDDLERLALEAFLYFYPLVLMETTRAVSTNWSAGERVGVAPMGMFAHAAVFPPANFRTIVRPNFDTLYSSAWIDVAKEPSIISIPQIRDRFFMLPLYDMWTDVFASPGTRTNGTEPFSFALCDPQWRGTLPSGVARIDAPTPVVWALGRTETRGVADYGAVHAIQAQLRLAPLSTWPEEPHVENLKDRDIDMKTPPMLQIDRMTSSEFFHKASHLVARQRAHITDWGMTTRLERAGLVAGQPFILEHQSDEVIGAFETAPQRALQAINTRARTLAALVNGWSTIADLGVYGNSYLKRAMIARWGLGANPTEESIYPNLQVDSEGRRLHGEHRYRLRFTPEEIPPVDAFWSLTVYDRQGYHVANEIDRFALGDRDPLVYAEDGTLEIRFAHERPEDHQLSNWLPIPNADFVVTMRLYLPRESALVQRWNPPALQRID